jgi:hypothetical protein
MMREFGNEILMIVVAIVFIGLLLAVTVNAGTVTVTWGDTAGMPVEVTYVIGSATNIIEVPATTNAVTIQTPATGWISVWGRVYVDEVSFIADATLPSVKTRRYGIAAGPLTKYLGPMFNLSGNPWWARLEYVR